MSTVGPVNASDSFVGFAARWYNRRAIAKEGQMPDVTIDWNAGRTQEQKDKIAKVVTDALVEIGKAPRENVKITFKDNPV